MVNPDVVPRWLMRRHSINDNYCKSSPVPVARPVSFVKSVLTRNSFVSVPTNVSYHVVCRVPTVTRWQSQKKDVRPKSKIKSQIKCVKSASFVGHFVSAPNVPNVPNVASVQPVGGRLQSFWEIWAHKGANPKVVSILKEGYVLPFKVRPPLVRDPLIVSGYANPIRDSHLQAAVQALIEKKAVERVRVQTSLAFFNRLFIVPKPNHKWRPILDLSTLNQFLCVKTFKMETPETIRTSLQQEEWVTSLDFSDAYFHIPKIPQVPLSEPVVPVSGTSLWPVNSSHGVHWCGQRGQVNGSVTGYKNPPVPRRLVDSSPYQRILPPGNPVPPSPLPGVGLDGKHAKIRTGTPTSLRLRRLPVRPTQRSSQAYSKPLRKNNSAFTEQILPSENFHVSYRSSHCDRKTGDPRQTAHETYSVAPQETLESPRISGKGDPNSEVSPSVPAVVDPRGKCPKGSALTPPATRSSNLYRRLKRRLGCSLRRLHSKRYLVSARKQVAHKLLRTKSRVVSTKKIPTFSARKGRPDCHRQHYGCSIHQQGRRYEVRLTLCPSLAAPMLVQPQSNSTEGQTHSRPSECNCRQIVSPKAGHSDGVVPPSRDLRPPLSNLALSPSGHVCNKVQLQASSICVPNSRPKGLVSGCSDIILGGPGHVPLPPSVSDGEGGQQAVRSLVSQSNPDCPGMAQHALVLGPSGAICEGSSLSSTPPRSSDPTFQQGTSQGSDKPKSPCLAPRAQTIKEQGFSSPVASRIEAPQRRSTRTVYEAKWAVFVRWCETSQVDFRNPSIKQIADFLLHLFQEKNLQPSTIDGYRSAIADKLGNTSVNVGKDDNLTRLLDSFHRDRPKGRRGVPAWNLSLVLHQLTKAPFEPLRKASLKHLTFKTVFLLALASGKRRSEIHAWLNKNIRHQADWSKVSLYPSPSFLAKNHLAKEGPECVAPVVIPALAPTLDKSLKEDRSLCPVRALRYYLDKTQDLRTGKELVFVSFKQGFNKDISPATISSWIKQTVVLCYDLSDQDSLTLHQVKAHDVRAFAASKAFQGGISLDQILAACHWKSHNTFTQFYLKDVAWADKELFHLGPVVAAQQIHH